MRHLSSFYTAPIYVEVILSCCFSVARPPAYPRVCIPMCVCVCVCAWCVCVCVCVCVCRKRLGLIGGTVEPDCAFWVEADHSSLDLSANVRAEATKWVDGLSKLLHVFRTAPHLLGSS